MYTFDFTMIIITKVVLKNLQPILNKEINDYELESLFIITIIMLFLLDSYIRTDISSDLKKNKDSKKCHFGSIISTSTLSISTATK